MNTNVKINRSDILYIVLGLFLALIGVLAVANRENDLGLYFFLGLIGLAFALAMFVAPSLGAYVLIIAIFSNISDELTNRGYPGIIEPLVALVVTAIAARFIYIEKGSTLHSKTWWIEFFLIFFFVVMTLSFVMASDQDRAQAAILDLGKDIVIIYCIFFALKSTGTWKNAIWVVIAVTFVLSILGVYQTLTGSHDQDFFGLATVKMDKLSSDSTTPRLGGPINAPNMWGQVIVSVMALVIFRLLHERNYIVKFIGLLILGILFFEMLETYSRGAYLALGVVLIMVFFLFEYRTNPVVTVSGFLAVVVAISFVPSNYLDRFSSLLTLSPTDEYAVYSDSSFRGRSSEMLTGLSMFASSPLLGVGAGNYKNNYQEFTQKIGIEMRAEARDPHSLYIQILAENGLLGFLAFVGLISALFNGLARAKQSIKALATIKLDWINWLSSMQVSLTGYLVAATFLHGAYIRYFWILVGLAIVAIRLSDEIVNNERQSLLVNENRSGSFVRRY